MGNGHGDLQRVDLRLIAGQHAVNIVTRWGVGNVFASGYVASGSVDVIRILQAVVEAAKLMLIYDLQKIS